MYSALTQQYRATNGTGQEDPSSYDMVLFDGNSTSPSALAGNPGVANFLSRGKMVVLLDNTEALRDAGLKGRLWAHAQGASPASAFFIVRDARGVPQRAVEIDAPMHVQPPPQGCSVDATTCGVATVIAPTAAQLAVDAQTWAGQVQNIYAALQAGGNTNIPPPITASGQAALNFDDLQAVSFTVTSYANGMIPGANGFYNDGSGFWCPSSALCNMPNNNRVNISADVSGTFESSISVLLEPNGSTAYQHRVILRQYSLASPVPNWGANYYLAFFSNPSGYDLVRTLTSTLGFNISTWMRTAPPASMALTSALPANVNNVTSVSTSSSNTQTIGLSATAGYQGGGAGLLGANWSDSWSWSQTSTVNVSDWSVQQSGNPGLTYVYSATGGTRDTYDALTSSYQWGTPNGNNALTLGSGGLNSLEQGNMVAQSETQWTSLGGPLPPAEQTFQSSTEMVQGEVFQYQPCDSTTFYDCTPDNYSNTPSATFTQPIVVDFSTPALQPPAPAPWTLSFSPWPQTVPTNATVTGTVTLSGPAANDTSILLTYVVQPQNTVNTLPTNEACQGNQYSFNPSVNVVNNGAPPLNVTIPRGQTAASFQLTFQTFNGNNYNVQALAWLPNTLVNGQTVVNPESAWCLTVPNTTIAGQSQARRAR